MSEPTAVRLVDASTISTSTTSAQSAALGTSDGFYDNSEIVRVAVNADTWIDIGANPTAVAQSAGAIFLPSGSVEYFDVPKGQKIAAILASGTGFMNVARMR